MERKEFEIQINASKEKVWNVLWKDASYRKWTAAFAEGSYAESDWKEGSKIVFMDPKGSGMLSLIKKKEVNKYMSFEHLGCVKDGVEDTESPEIKKWQGASENYLLTESNGKTILQIEIDIAEEYMDYFEKTWPIALKKVKDLSEERKF